MTRRWLLMLYFSVCSFVSFAEKIVVTNNKELIAADKNAKPGDEIIFANGEWPNVIMQLRANGTAGMPIIYRAQNEGKVRITGHSQLQLGGDYLVVDGLYFTDGFAGSGAVIDFKIDKKQLANNCRVTNTVINDFNNRKRMDENNWVTFYGKKNRLDHCSFLNKKNMGVLLAVILDDDRSRENFHSIDHNYFGLRLPLASNTGELIRVGVSQHCEFNSNTQIIENFFEHCDGETEIVSIKSGSNVVRNNVFKECQGGVVLRHGNDNTVEGNIFLGNDKEGTGGVRIINRGQWVINNFFYKCRGVDFRSPLSVMNGIPNSPANRYVQVTDAVIMGNSFIECAPVSFCEGSDTERTLPPARTFFLDNYFKNKRDGIIYKSYDDISGISFSANKFTGKPSQPLVKGFGMSGGKLISDLPKTIADSLMVMSKPGVNSRATPVSPLHDLADVSGKVNSIITLSKNWFTQSMRPAIALTRKVNAKNADEIISALTMNNNEILEINLTGKEYQFPTPLFITRSLVFSSSNKQFTRFSLATTGSDFFIHLNAGYNLSFNNIQLDISGLDAKMFITTDTSGGSGHSNFSISNAIITGLRGTFFHAAKSTVCDSVVVQNTTFTNNKGTLFNFSEEDDKKGYYNVEKLKIINNVIVNHEEQILTMLRGGNDESTMGPLLVFTNNKISGVKAGRALLELIGTQKSFVENNIFVNSNTRKELIHYEDFVRAVHVYKGNRLSNSGTITRNKYVVDRLK